MTSELNFGKLAYETFMNSKGHYSSDDEWIGFEGLSSTDQRAWDAAAQMVSDATRGWIATRISGPIE